METVSTYNSLERRVFQTNYGFIVHLRSTEDYPLSAVVRNNRDKQGVLRLIKVQLTGNSPNIGGHLSLHQVFCIKGKNNSWIGYGLPLDIVHQNPPLHEYTKGTLEYLALEKLAEAAFPK